MSTYFRSLAVACLVVPSFAAAQSSVATAFRTVETDMAKNLIAAAEAMPADKYSFKPTPAQMTFGNIVTHLSGGNDALCSVIGGTTAPTRSKVAPTDSKEVLVKRLRETFEYCNTALAGVDDSKLSEILPVFGDKISRARTILETTGDWSDHYSQAAIYLRLNGVLPPTAKK